MTERLEQTAKHGVAEQRPSSVLELVGSDRAMSTVLSFLGLALPIFLGDEGQFSGERLREALALGRVLPGVCIASLIKVGPAGAALLASDACLGGLLLESGSSFAHVFDALKLNTGLRKLDTPGVGLNAGDVALLCGALAVNSSLVDVDISGSAFGGPGARAMAAVLSTTTSLQKLSLRRCKLQPGDVALLASGVVANASLRELVLDRNNVGEAGGHSLGAALETNSTLHVLKLNSANLGDAGGCAIGAALASNTGLFELDLDVNEFGEATVGAMAAALATNTSLRWLGLNGNKALGSSGAVALFGALRSNHTLLQLNMRETGLDHASGVALADMVRENSNLEVLDLSYNDFRAWDGSGSCSWAPVLAALKDNSGLHTLSLRNCKLSAADGQALAQALEQRPAGLLCDLDVSDNLDLGDDACSAIIVACLQPGSALRELNIGSSGAGLTVTLSLAGCLRANHTLEVLLLEEMDAESNWPELFGALAVNSGLRSLDLQNCLLKQRDVEALAAAVQTNRVLQSLRVYDVGLGDTCAQIMAGGLATNTTLRILQLFNRSSPLGEASAYAFCRLLQTNSTLRELTLGYEDSCATPAKEALEHAGRATGCHISFDPKCLFFPLW